MPNEVSGLPVYSSKSDPWESYGHVHETGSLSIPCSQCQCVCLRAGRNLIPFTPNPGFCQQPFFQNPLGKPSKSPGTAKKAWRDSETLRGNREIRMRGSSTLWSLDLEGMRGPTSKGSWTYIAKRGIPLRTWNPFMPTRLMCWSGSWW